MPKLLRSSETFGCGATIELDNGEVVFVSVARTGVLVRLIDQRGGFLKGIVSNWSGPKLYNEKNIYNCAKTSAVLTFVFPDRIASLCFKNPNLTAFANAIWHCSSSAEVCAVLNEALAKAPEIQSSVEDASLKEAYEAAENWGKNRPSEMTTATYSVVYSDGVRQETRFVPSEIDKWVLESTKDFENRKQPYRIVRIVDKRGKTVWEK